MCVFTLAFITSIAHELEHDLIHHQYFHTHPFIQNCMLLGAWLLRPNTVNPWYRRHIHFNHHRTSGTPHDIEERLVGNGEKNIFVKLLIISDGLLGLILRRKKLAKEIPNFKFFTVFNAGAPLATCHFILLYSFIIYHSLDYFFPLTERIIHNNGISLFITNSVFWLNTLVIIFVLPNIIRSISLNLITSTMHYYGGVNNLLQQTQVLTHWLFIPFQFFCFNFGRTHSIHHFVPNQPFYIRQLIAKKVHAVMKENGVRFNDFRTALNGNFFIKTSDIKSDKKNDKHTPSA